MPLLTSARSFHDTKIHEHSATLRCEIDEQSRQIYGCPTANQNVRLSRVRVLQGHASLYLGRFWPAGLQAPRYSLVPRCDGITPQRFRTVVSSFGFSFGLYGSCRPEKKHQARLKIMQKPKNNTSDRYTFYTCV